MSSSGSSAPSAHPPVGWATAFRFLVGFLFLYGAWLRWTDGFVAITTPDSFQYLLGTLKGDLREVAWRTFVYPLFLKLCVEHLGGLVAVLAIQKMFGLLAAALVLATWMRLKAVVNFSRWGRVIHDLLGLLLLAMMLLPFGSTRYFEQTIMLESASTLALASILFAACQLLVELRRSSRPQTVTVWAAVLIGLSLFANTLNPRFGPAVLLSFLFALGSLRLARASLGQYLTTLLLPVVLAVPLLILPQRALNQRNVWNSSFVPMHFLFVHARLVLPEIVHDRDDPSFTRYDHAFLQQLSAEIEQVFALADQEGLGGNYTLKFDPNRLLWGRGAALMRDEFRDSPPEFGKFCRYYFLRAVGHHPAAYLKKVADEWWFLLRPGGAVVDDSWPPLPLASELSACPSLAETYVEKASDTVRPAFIAYQAQLADSRTFSGVVFRTPFPLNYFGNWINRGFSLLWLFVFCLCSYCLWRRRADRGLRYLCLIFMGSSIFLFGQLAPLALVTTTCGTRAIQGLRVLFVFTIIDMGFMALLLPATLSGWRHWLLDPSSEPGTGAAAKPPA